MCTRILSAFLLAICMSLSGEAADLRSNEMIIGGGRCEIDGFAIGGPSLVLRRGVPGVLVATIEPSGKNRSYSYVLFIKGDEQRSVLAKYDLKQGIKGSVATGGGFVEIAGRRVTIEYEFSTGHAARESLLINGESVNLDAGRVVLIDLSGKTVMCKQAPLTFSEIPACPKETAELEMQSRTLLAEVRKQSAIAREFLK